MNHRILLDILDDSIGAEDWIDDAVCASTDPEAFYPEKGMGGHGHVKKICARCPVQPDCLEYAMRTEFGLSHSVRYGVWGGLGPVSRAELDKKRRRESEGAA